MRMHVKIEPWPDHLHVVVDGLFDHAQLADALKSIFDASSKHGLRKILVDSRALEGEVSLMARYDIGRIAAGLQREPVRLVMVASKEHIWPDHFGENVANNLGVKSKVTPDMAEAYAWLNEDAGPKK